jgi:hypothetical protein
MMKLTIDVSDEDGKTVFAQTYWDLPNEAPDRALHLARETERLMEMYPAYSAINIQVEPDGAAAADVSKPTRSEQSAG